MLFEFLRPLVKTGLLVDDGDKIYFDTTKPDWVDSVTEFYILYLSEKLRLREEGVRAI